MDRPRHRVSVKIAFSNKTGDRVLMTRLHDGGYGLPGGHIEVDETPEQALSREIYEELGLQNIYNAQRVDFWRDLRTERIILGYHAVLDEGVEMQLDPREIAGIYWASLADFDQGAVSSITYEAFIRKVLKENMQNY